MSKLLEIKNLTTQFFTSAGTVQAVDEVSFDISNAGSWTTATKDLSGLNHNATDSTFLKVTWRPLSDGYIALFDANMWIPGQRIDDPNVIPANGLSGFDDSSLLYVVHFIFSSINFASISNT